MAFIALLDIDTIPVIIARIMASVSTTAPAVAPIPRRLVPPVKGAANKQRAPIPMAHPFVAFFFFWAYSSSVAIFSASGPSNMIFPFLDSNAFSNSLAFVTITSMIVIYIYCSCC